MERRRRLELGRDRREVARAFANAHELSLARSFVEQLGDLPKDKTGDLLYEVKGSAEAGDALAARAGRAPQGPDRARPEGQVGRPRPAPHGPAVACKVVVGGTADKPEATVFVATTDGTGDEVGPGRQVRPAGDA